MKLYKSISTIIVAFILVFSCSIFAEADTIYTIDGYSYTLIDTDRATLVGWDYSSETLTVPHKIGNVYVSAIGDSAFSGDNYIKSVGFSDAKRMYKIGTYAFANSALEGNLIIPTRVTNVGIAAFEGCNIESVHYSSDGGIVSAQSFKDCKALKNVFLTDYITSIERHAFSGCANLENVTIPKSVNNINSTAFNGCYDFTIKCYRDSYAMQYAIDNGINYEILDPLIGDVNGDEEINIMDATIIQKKSLGIATADVVSNYDVAADVSKDGFVNIRDVTLIQMYVAGIITKF